MILLRVLWVQGCSWFHSGNMHSVFTLYKILGGTGVKKDLVLCFQKMIVCIFRIHLWMLCLLKALLLRCVQLFTQAAFLLKLSVYQVFFSQGASYLNEKPHNILPVGCFFFLWKLVSVVCQPKSIISHLQEMPSGSNKGVDVWGNASCCVWHVWLSSAECQVGQSTLGFQREELNRNASEYRNGTKQSWLRLSLGNGVEWDVCCLCRMNSC